MPKSNRPPSENRTGSAHLGNSRPESAETATQNLPNGSLPNTKRRTSSNLTLLTWSDILKNIDTKRLGNQVRVKTLELRDKLKTMNLEPYEKIILHIAECDVTSGANIATVTSNIHALVLDLRAKFTVLMSCLLPRKVYDIKTFNSEIKQLCQEYDVEFIDHYESFVMALVKYLGHFSMVIK